VRTELRAVAIGAMLAAACGSTPSSPSTPPAGSTTLTPVASTGDWPASTPDTEGLDASILGDLVGRIRRGDYGNIDSLLVVRHEKLVVEEYFGARSAADVVHTLQSVSKSVTSLLTGLAIERGRLRPDDRVVERFPQYVPIANMDDRKASLTVRDLLTMRDGFDWNENIYAGSPLQRLNDCRCDWIRFMLDWPMREQPGTRWEYVSGGVILLGAVVGSAVGERIDLFGDRELFAPLGIRGAYWIGGLPDGLPHTGGGLYMRPRDMAKLGSLMVTGGRWQGSVVISDAWIRESTQRAVSRPRTFGAHGLDYGYLWWILDLADPMNPRPQAGDIITASGAQGQWIFAIPREDLVMISTAQNGDSPHANKPTDFLFTHVLASVKR
jgi:CubicO group peptidase (beta-lactamase class C family)